MRVSFNDLTAYLKSEYPDCPPVAHKLRRKFKDRWVRFHSLPDSKRYADSDAEYEIILFRYNSVLAGLAQDQPPIWLITTAWSELECSDGKRELLKSSDVKGRFWHSIDSTEADLVPRRLNFFASSWDWRPGLFDPLLKLVADWQEVGLIVTSPSTRSLYCPYDGGADVILADSFTRDELRQRHSEWLSVHPSGC